MQLPPRSLLLVAALSLTLNVNADDGYRLWLGPVSAVAPGAATGQAVGDATDAAAGNEVGKEVGNEIGTERFSRLVARAETATQRLVRDELRAGWPGLPVSDAADAEGLRAGALLAGTPASLPVLAELGLGEALATLGAEGFLIRSAKLHGHEVTVIAANSDAGVLYGAFHLLRLLRTATTGDAATTFDVVEKPRFALRLLNHWDNLDGSIERGYAGRSLWKWDELPDRVDPRLADYARANASLGLNGSVLNNVNARAQSLSAEYLRKTAAIAEVFRPYGVRVYLSARFSSPIELGGLPKADPLDPAVAAWWRAKADEIYTLIPDFGGFLVKANSEGQPGPLTYGRTHADGANMLAAALAPHGGVVMWRAFVYEPEHGSDRISQAYDALKPFDGQFAANVLVQVKNGPLDFMPREPFHPLFGGMAKTQVMPELQVTQEYLGHDKQLAFLAPMWREFLDADTFSHGQGSTVLKSVDGSLTGQRLTGIAGVANTGSDRNWTGHLLAQANWYAFGRLAWDPELSSRRIAEEWTALTFGTEPRVAATLPRLLLESREAVVDYSMPLGLHHLIWADHHYGPQPWCDYLPRPDWNPIYFHRAAVEGIGFDRTPSGSNSVRQYNPGAREAFADLATCPEELLLWFHRVPWDHPMKSGRTLWDELCVRYQRGVDWTREARRSWAPLADVIDAEAHAAVAAKLAIQETDALRWRDACLLYFQTFSKRPFPVGVEPARHTLEELRATDPLKASAASDRIP